MADDTVTVVDAYRTESGASRGSDIIIEDENYGIRGGTDADIDSARADVERTRANIGDTLSAIQEKLDPKALMDQAKDTVQEMTAQVTGQAKTALHDVASDVMGQAKSTAHDVTQEVKDTVGGAVTATKEAVENAYETTKNAGASLMDTAMKNPLPTLLLAGGAWYLWSNFNAERRHPANGYAVTSPGDEQRPSVVYALWDTAKRNPIPAAMAVGAAMHFYNGSSNHGAASIPSGSVSSTVHDASAAVSETLKAAGEKAGDMVDGAKEAIGGAVGTVKDTLGSAATSIQRTATEATHSAGDLVHQVSQNISGGARDAGTNLVEYVQKNPLPAAALALGIGVTIAMLLPDTEPENRLLGKTRDSLVDTAQHSASDFLEKVQNVSTKTIAAVSDAATQEAKNQGLTA